MGQLVSIVLVTWNSAPYLRRCLEGIRQQTHGPVELIVVDNASTDESVALIESDEACHSEPPERAQRAEDGRGTCSGDTPDATTSLRVIRNSSNRGFSAAVNQALAVANGPYVLLLNPDCYLQPDYVARLVAAFDGMSSDFGAATGLLLRASGTDIEPTGEVDSMGIRMTRAGRHLDLGQGQPLDVAKLPQGGRPFEVFGVSGAAAMFRAAFLRDVSVEGQVFDEDFFAYREDADLAWRGRVLGWRAFCEPAAVAYHVRRVTPEVRRELPAAINMHSVKNRFLLRIKNEGLYLALRNAPFELARDLVVFAASLTIERTSFPAFSWLWRNRSRVLARRRAIQQRRRVSDFALARWFR